MRYDGEFANDLQNGYGKHYNEQNKLVYDGQWKNGKRNGHGVM